MPSDPKDISMPVQFNAPKRKSVPIQASAPKQESMLHITGPSFCAGVVLAADVVTHAAPILDYMLGWPAARVIEYCYMRRWLVEDGRGVKKKLSRKLLPGQRAPKRT